jgi:hypothetical protein
MSSLFGVQPEASQALGGWLVLLGAFITLVTLAWVCL